MAVVSVALCCVSLIELPSVPTYWKTKVEPHGTNRLEIAQILDKDRHRVSTSWSKGEWKASEWKPGWPRRYVLTPASDGDEFSFVCRFSPLPIESLPRFAETASAKHGPKFWQSSGAIDLSASKDPRWRELERRIVLAQYLTAVNPTGSSPPQASGLLSNSWHGKFHLEMTAWQGAQWDGRCAIVRLENVEPSGSRVAALRCRVDDAIRFQKSCRWVLTYDNDPHAARNLGPLPIPYRHCEVVKKLGQAPRE